MLTAILTVAFDPLVQKTVDFTDGLVEDQNVPQLGISSFYQALGPSVAFDCEFNSIWLDPSALNLTATVYRPESFLKGNIITALSSRGKSAPNDPSYSCDSTNCQWDRAATLAFEARCTDLTPQLIIDSSKTDKFNRGPGQMSLPDWGPTIFYGDAHGAYVFMNITAKSTALDSHVSTVRCIRANLETTNLTTTSSCDLLKRYNGTSTATECTIDLVVQSLSASVKNGVYEETIHDTWSPGPGWRGLETDGVPGSFRPPWDESKGVKANQSFGISSNTWNALVAGPYLALADSDSPMPNPLMLGHSYDSDGHCALLMNGTNPDVLQSIFYAKYNATTCDTPDDNFACAFKTVAKSLTNSIRSSGLLANGTASSETAPGRSFSTTTLVRVQYQWLALPAAVWLLSVVTWLGSWYHTSRANVPRWRDNIVPLIFLRQDSSEGAYLTSGLDVAAVDMLKDLKMKFDALPQDLKFEILSKA